MKKLLLLQFITFFAVHSISGQSENSYTAGIKEAWDLYKKQEYKQSGIKYNEVFSLLDKDITLTENLTMHRYNAACSWALARNKDAAFKLLYEIAEKGNYSQYQQMENDTDFQSLYSDPRWQEVIQIVKNNYDAVKPLSKEVLAKIFEAYQKAYDNVFRAGSDVKDVTTLFNFYTDDFEYNHPGYGGIYSRELLYNNTLKFLKKGDYNDTPKRITLKKIIGKNAVVVEQQYEGETKTTMTLFRFKKDKIHYIEEYW